MPYIKKIREQTPEMKRLAVLTKEVEEIKETLKRSFNELRRNSIIFRTIDAKRRKLNECEGLNSIYSIQRNEKRKFDEIDEIDEIEESDKIGEIVEKDEIDEIDEIGEIVEIVEKDETIIVKPNLINNKKIKHISENDKFSTCTDNKYMESITDIKIDSVIKKLKCYEQKLPTIIEEDEEDEEDAIDAIDGA